MSRLNVGAYRQGVIVCVVVALSAAFLANQYEMPALLLALLLGMALAFVAGIDECRAGIEFAAGPVLRIGVALLGFRFTLDSLLSLGWTTLLLVAGAAVLTVLAGVRLARSLGLHSRFGALSGGAVAICGVSAAIALASVMPSSKSAEQHLALTVVTVTVFGSIAMIFYPALVGFLDLSVRDAGIFLGASIHDVSHVVGAGYSVSPQVGDVAILTKMMRVLLLVPAVACFYACYRRETQVATGRFLPVPWFLLAFVALAVVASVVTVPPVIESTAESLSRWCLLIAIAALGIKTSVRAMVATGWRPIVLVLCESLFLGAMVLAWCLLH